MQALPFGDAADLFAEATDAATEALRDLVSKGSVPPAGYVEVLAFLDPQGDAMDAESGALFAAKYPNYTALVDRTHITRLQAVNAALQARLTVADEQVDILSGGLRLMTSFGSGTNIAGVKTVAKQTLNRAAAVAFNADTPAPK